MAHSKPLTPLTTKPDFESFFTSTSEPDISRDIALLSYLLTRTHTGGSVRKPEEKKDQEEEEDDEESNTKDSALDPWMYLSFIINTGELTDKAGNKVVAVTGQLQPNMIAAALVTRNTTPNFVPPDTPPLVIKGPIRPQVRDPRSVVIEAFEAIEQPDVDGHIQDIVDLLDAFIRVPFPESRDEAADEESMLATRFFMFVAARCHLKLHARIDNGKRLWSDHPTNIIQAWYVDRPDRFSDRKTLWLPEMAIGFLKKHHQLSPISEERSSKGKRPYTVEPDNVHLWVNMLVKCREDMDKLFLSFVPENGLNRLKLADAAYAAAVVLDAVFRNGLLNVLVTKELASDLRRRYEEKAPKSTLSRYFESETEKKAVQKKGQTAATPPPTVAAQGPTFEPSDDEKTVFESNRKHIIRYLKTLTIPYAAAKFLVHYCRKFSSISSPLHLHAFKVDMKPSAPAVTVADVRAFRDRFLAHFPFPDEGKGRIKTVLSMFQKPLGALHAEAIIMSLAYTARASVGAEGAGAMSSIKPLFEGSPVPIGVNKKCCFCCELLAFLLEGLDSGPSFLLQGTHSTVFPWVPPDGVPVTVLQKMRIELVKILYNTVFSYVKPGAASTQTSPVSVASDDYPSRPFTFERLLTKDKADGF